MKKSVVLFFIISAISADQDPFIAGYDDFAASLYQEIAASSEENVFLSPFSVDTILALLQSGAVGATAEEIRSTLCLPPTKEAVEATFQRVLPQLRSGSNFTLRSANRIYLRSNFSLNQNFQKTANEIYNSSVSGVNFRQKNATVRSINQWVEEQTYNEIQNPIDPSCISDETTALLINTLSFRGTFRDQFNVAATGKKEFRKEEGVFEVDTMSQVGYFNYYECDKLQAKFLQLPFGDGEALITFVLPNDLRGLSGLEKQVGDIFLERNYTREKVFLSLPRFKFDFKSGLKETLKKLGVKKAFCEKDAEFGGVIDDDSRFYIDEVVQKTSIEVCESGVEAEAASLGSIAAGINSDLDGEPRKFIADHAFFFYIQVRDIITFVGRLISP